MRKKQNKKTPREFDAIDIGPPKKEMPFEMWLLAVEYQSFVEEVKMDLEKSGIVMQEIKS